MESTETKRSITQRIALISASISLLCIAIMGIVIPTLYYQLEDAQSRLYERIENFKVSERIYLLLNGFLI